MVWDRYSILDIIFRSCAYPISPSEIFLALSPKSGSDEERQNQAYVTDCNNDGMSDFLIGTSIATVYSAFNYVLYFSWEYETGIIIKDPANYNESYKKMIKSEMERAEKRISELGIDSEEARKRNLVTCEMLFKNYYGKEEYRTLAHKGYVYVMLGEKQKR